MTAHLISAPDLARLRELIGCARAVIEVGEYALTTGEVDAILEEAEGLLDGVGKVDCRATCDFGSIPIPPGGYCYLLKDQPAGFCAQFRQRSALAGQPMDTDTP